MSNKINPIPPKAKNTLDLLVKEFGINVIKDYINHYNRSKRKKNIRHNSREEIVKMVYELIVNHGYDRTRAINKVSEEKGLSDKTINNHLYKFEKEAKENNFFTYGFIYNEMLEYYNGSYKFYDDLNEFVKINHIDEELFYLYYLRYKSLPKRKKNQFKLDFNNIKFIDQFQHIPAIREAIKDFHQQNNSTKNNVNQNLKEDNNILDNDIDLDEIPF